MGSTTPMMVAVWFSVSKTRLPSGFSCGKRCSASARLTMICGTKREASCFVSAGWISSWRKLRPATS